MNKRIQGIVPGSNTRVDLEKNQKEKIYNGRVCIIFLFLFVEQVHLI